MEINPIDSRAFVNIQNMQNALSSKTDLYLVLINKDGEKLTIPSKLPDKCFQNEIKHKECKEFKLNLIERAKQSNDIIIRACPNNLYSFSYKTNFYSNNQPLILFGGRVTNLKQITENKNLIMCIYSLPIWTDYSYFSEQSLQTESKTKINTSLYCEELYQLTQQEIKVLCYLGMGLSNKGIANKLYISPNTVKTHVSNILRKLNCNKRTDAALFALNIGLVEMNQIV